MSGQRYLHSTDPEERYANEFAMALIMPAICVREFQREGMPLLVMAQRFNVEPHVMRMRLEQLGPLPLPWWRRVRPKSRRSS